MELVFSVCKMGYGGTGRVCTICLENTYSDVLGDGGCTPCPGSSGTAVQGATDSGQCGE